MSNYTTQLRFICESYANRNNKPQPQSDIDSTIELARPKIFDFDYPIFDEEYKKTLESKIISHYYTREIGLETVGLFKHHLKNKMREIMPYYNQLYKSERLKFDPFINTSYEDVKNSSTKDEKETSNNTSGNNKLTTHNEGIDNRNTIGSSYGNENGNNEIHSQGRTDDSSDANGKTEFDKTGKEKTTHTIPESTTLVKHSDTPLGSVDNVVADNSNYLSDVTQTKVTNGDAGDDELSFTNRKDTTNVENHQSNSGTSADDTQSKDERKHNDYHTENTDSSNQSDSTTEGERSDESNGVEKSEGSSDYFGRLFGKTGSETYSEMLLKFRDTFLNIDNDIIKELEPLFMLLW